MYLESVLFFLGNFYFNLLKFLKGLCERSFYEWVYVVYFVFDINVFVIFLLYVSFVCCVEIWLWIYVFV